jgi:tyrosyl-tRNA synthetase
MGGTDQRKIMVLAREKLPQLGYEKRIELMNPLIPGFVGAKMSSSVAASKIGLLDKPKEVEKKLKSADFEEGNPKNGVMAFFENIIFVLKKDKGEKLIIERPEKFGGNLEFNDYSELERAVVEKSIHPLDIKVSCAKEIIKVLSGIEENREELEEIASRAYPKE